MNNLKRLPTLLGLFLLLIGLGAGLILIKNTPAWLTKANPTTLPQEIHLTNITDTSFVVSWLTDTPTQGSLKYGQNQNLNLTLSDDGPKNLHYLQINNLLPQTTYSFQIFGDSQVRQTITASTLTTPNPSNNLAYGLVTDAAGNPVSTAIIYLTYPNLSPQSALTTSSGNWVIPLHLARSENLTDWFNPSSATGQLSVQAGQLGTTTAVIDPQNDTPVPPLTLGKNYNFTQTLPTPTNPNPDSPTQPGRFTLDTSSTTIIIHNPQADEKISTRRPEFWGTAPPNTALTLEINSSAPLTQQLTTTPTGGWSWTPSHDLTTGEHTLSVALPDGTTAIRHFIILAAGDDNLPAFTATPSGQTITPTPTLPPRTSKPATTAGTPTAGDLTPTFFLSIMGIGLIISGLIICGRIQLTTSRPHQP